MVAVSSELSHRHRASVQAQALSELHQHNPHKVQALAHHQDSVIHNPTQVEVEDSLAEQHNSHQLQASVVEDSEHPHRLRED